MPGKELSKFLRATTAAVRFAREGRIAAGYTVLLAGLKRAEALQADGEVWAEELARRYREAKDRYAEEWGVRMA